jgi:hypothetical protein
MTQPGLVQVAGRPTWFAEYGEGDPLETYRSLPDAELAAVPRTSHVRCMEEPAGPGADDRAHPPRMSPQS